MGYTHYWRPTRDLTEDEWDNIRQVAKTILKDNHGIILDNEPTDSQNLSITYESILCNGIGDDGHETFYLTRKMRNDFEFCKTAQKPYDKYIVAMLIAVAQITDSISVSSDGDQEDWLEGLQLYVERCTSNDTLNDYAKELIPDSVRVA
tara:strand:- start:652 stop:1098 length:447 start_codon:yes stop_codon:yes gene_type:complete